MASEAAIKRYVLVRRSRRGGDLEPRVRRLELVPVADPAEAAAIEGTADLDLSPPLRNGSLGPLSEHVANEVRNGRRLFDVLDDPLIQDRLDQGPMLLSDIAGDPAVREALEAQMRRR
jgi:hypothetical protein